MKKLKNKQNQIKKSRQVKHKAKKQPNKKDIVYTTEKYSSKEKHSSNLFSLPAPEYTDRELLMQIEEEERLKKARDLLLFQDMKNELAGIIKWYGETPSSPFQLARTLLYKALLPFEIELTDNKILEDYDRDSIVLAGRILFESEGMRGMRDRLLWSFIPKRLYGLIDKLWNGIGEWQA